MTSHERFTRMYEHRDADRVPVIDSPWGATIERWRREGMPENVSYVDYFGLDKVSGIYPDYSPRYEARILEETDEYRICTTGNGATLKEWKHAASTPEFLDFKIKDRESWAEASKRMEPSRDRVNWERLRNNYPEWRKRGDWIEAELNFGFDLTHSWMVGTDRVLLALIEDPEWMYDMFNRQLTAGLAMLDMIWDEGYRFDVVCWSDDMGYKGKQFFSLDTYRELEKPFHKRAVEWAHAHGIKAHLQSCGCINPFVPELIEIGLDALNPLEVKAGMNPIQLKRDYGKDLVFHGGVNAVLWTEPEKIEAEMRRVIPALKENGGYIFSSDHSVPSAVSLEDFRRIVNLAKDLGKY